jgi:hypothetical protein
MLRPVDRESHQVTRYHAETHKAETVHQFAAQEPDPRGAASVAVSPREPGFVYPPDRAERHIMRFENFAR